MYGQRVNVSEIAREVGIAPSAVRFYERRGILPRPGRLRNGYRDYSAEDVSRIRLVVTLRQLGLELATAGRLADLCVTGQCELMARDLAPLIASQREAVVRAQAQLHDLDRRLARLADSLSDDNPDPDVWMPTGGADDGYPRLGTGTEPSMTAGARLLEPQQHR